MLRLRAAFLRACPLDLQPDPPSRMQVLSFPDFKPERTMKGHVSRVSCMGFDHRHTRMASGGMDTVTSLWDLEEGICTQTFYDLDQAIRGVGWVVMGGKRWSRFSLL